MHKDDLGSPGAHDARGHERYPNILAFADQLEQYSVDQGGYAQLRTHMPASRLAGWNLEVSSRALYFSAAAQVGMDERGHDGAGAGSGADAAGHGHWIATGAFARVITDVQRVLRSLATDHGRPRPRPIAGGVEIFTTVRGEMARMLEVLQAQQDHRVVRGHNPDEHDEPELRALLLPRSSAILGVAVPTTDAGVPAAATALLAAIGTTPSLGAHEAGATDPHGTAHAMGVAFDMFDGVHGENMGMPSAYFPFFRYLIQQHPGEFGLTGHERPTSSEDSPHVLRGISQLLRAYGASTTAALRAQAAQDRTDEAHDPASRHALPAADHARAHLRSALQDRLTALFAAGPSIPRDARAAADAEILALQSDLAAISDLVPAELISRAHAHDAALRALSSSAPPLSVQAVSTAPPLFALRPEASRPPLPGVIAELEALPRGVQGALDRRTRREALTVANMPGLEGFVQSAVRHPTYDQPDVMVAAMEDVHTRSGPPHQRQTSFYGTHHWAVTNLDVLEPDGQAYERSLETDISRRTPAQLERILTVMSEGAGGRAALFGPTPDPQLTQALTARLGADLQSVLDRVRARVVTPFENDTHTDGGADLRAQLRFMGYYLATPP